MPQYLNKIFITLILFTQISLGSQKLTCIEKLEQLDKLKQERISLLEKSALFLFTGSILLDSQRNENKLNEQKIRVLEMELKSCQ